MQASWDTIEVMDSRECYKEFMPGMQCFDIEARLTGEPIIQEGKPVLVQDAKILDLLREVNKKFRGRTDEN